MPNESAGPAPSRKSRYKSESPVCVVRELKPDASPEIIQAARSLLLEYGRFVQSQTGVASFCFGSLEKEAADLPQRYLAQDGGAFLAGYYHPDLQDLGSEQILKTVSQARVIRAAPNEVSVIEEAMNYQQEAMNYQPAIRWVGFIAWRALPSSHLSNACEVKRLWVRPEARGLRMGRLLVQAVIERALADDKTELLLDTVPSAMASAHRLYNEMGFVECPPYSGLGTEGILYMRKPLGTGPEMRTTNPD